MSTVTNIRLFALDDSEATLTLIETVIIEEGIQKYKLFRNSSDFLTDIDDSVHIAIIDHQLSGLITGLNIAEEIVSKHPRCFIIILSGMESVDLISEYVKIGIDYYINKNRKDFLIELGAGIRRGIRRTTQDFEFWNKMLNRESTARIV